MTQPPVSVRLTLPAKQNFLGGSGLVQVLQAQPCSDAQTVIQQRSQNLKPLTTIRPFVPTVPGMAINTNTAVQYVRKPAEISVLGATGTFVAAPMSQTFTPFVNPIMSLNPSLISSIPGGPTGGPGQVGGLGATSGVLSSLANSRKPCNCTKSHCLKLYCECFAQGQLCQNCNCNNCMNNLAYEEERGRAIKMTLERNPTAFHPKIGRGEGERKHTKGCNCKRSGCLKNYCECYEAKISCSDLCRCQGCRNTEDSVERRSLMRLAAMGALRSRQPSSFKKHLVKPPSETLPHVFFTWEVIEATASCLLAQADEAERRDLPPAAQERIILEEFGRALERVIEAASKAQIRSSSGIHTSASIDDNDQGLIHSGGSTGPGSLGGKGNDDIMSDEDPVERAHAIPSSARQGMVSHRYQEIHSRRTSQTVEDRYIHSRRSMSSRNYRHHDPDSMV
ncbi:Protein lin-54 like [Schistosoma japonicum]|nr:Protein lin-54 like [Schistosoma japonicum]